jgi:hypothetical protein
MEKVTSKADCDLTVYYPSGFTTVAAGATVEVSDEANAELQEFGKRYFDAGLLVIEPAANKTEAKAKVEADEKAKVEAEAKAKVEAEAPKKR